MKIVIALNNGTLKEDLEKRYGDKVYKYDILDKESVIELLSKLREEEVILLTKDSLVGNIDKYFYIKQLRLAHENLKIVYFVENLDIRYKEFLFANEVFNIIEGDEISLEEIEENIQSDKKIIYKKSQKICDNKVEYMVQNNVLTKANIAVFGTSGAGKSIVSSIINNSLIKKLKLKTFLLDMDIQNSSLDIINNWEKESLSLNTVMDYIDKYKDIGGLFGINSKNNHMSADMSIYDVQNKIAEKYYEKIYKNIFGKFDYCLIDLPNSIFLDVVGYTVKMVDKIIFVINPNYVSIRQAKKYLEVMVKIWNIPVEKIGIIVNKIDKYSLNKNQIKSLLGNYNIIMEIPIINNINSYINSYCTDINIDVDNSKLYEFLDIRENLLLPKKTKLKITSLFKGVVNDS